jgi:hypothetical protein
VREPCNRRISRQKRGVLRLQRFADSSGGIVACQRIASYRAVFEKAFKASSKAIFIKTVVGMPLVRLAIRPRSLKDSSS